MVRRKVWLLASSSLRPDANRRGTDAAPPNDTSKTQDPPQGESGHNPRSSTPQAVRFASGVQEIEPVHSIHQMVVPSGQEVRSTGELTPEAKEEIRNLAITLQKSKLQESRMSNYAFEPVSLPPSRVGHDHRHHLLDFAFLPQSCPPTNTFVKYWFTDFTARQRPGSPAPMGLLDTLLRPLLDHRLLSLAFILHLLHHVTLTRESRQARRL